MDASILAARTARTVEYLDTLARVQSHSAWSREYQAYLESRATSLGLALIHPSQYEGIAPRDSIQGARAFAVELGQATQQCASARVWGYQCSLAVDTRCADHVFPYALGGPTVSTNKLILCGLHNQLKGSDVHMYPWEDGAPIWLDDLLKRIAVVMKRVGR